MNSRPSTVAPILAAILLLLLPLGAYVTGYFWLGERISVLGNPPSDMPTEIIRIYPHRWQESAFHPAAVVEGWLRGTPVFAGIPPDDFMTPNAVTHNYELRFDD